MNVRHCALRACSGTGCTKPTAVVGTLDLAARPAAAGQHRLPLVNLKAMRRAGKAVGAKLVLLVPHGSVVQHPLTDEELAILSEHDYIVKVARVEHSGTTGTTLSGA